MLHTTLSQIEKRLATSQTLTDENRTELLQLLATLRAEINSLPPTENERAQSIASFTDISTHEATRSDPNTRLRQISLEGLAASVSGFEGSHPRLVHLVNTLCQTLANMGI